MKLFKYLTLIGASKSKKKKKKSSDKVSKTVDSSLESPIPVHLLSPSEVLKAKKAALAAKNKKSKSAADIAKDEALKRQAACQKKKKTAVFS